MIYYVLLAGFLALGGGVYYVLWDLLKEPPLPNLDPNEWWGPNELQGVVDTAIRPFKITFDEAMVKDLKYRLKNVRPFNPPLEGVAFEYGFNSKQTEEWVKYWAEEYDFEKQEKFLNQFPQYTTNIQGLNIHFIRVKPQVPAGVQVLPLLLIHGFPGSVREFYEVIPKLTRQQPGYDFAFEVIVPALPGFGYSDGAVRPGLGLAQAAHIFKNLMDRLGFKKFYVQGGDWGSIVAADIATFYPEAVLGYHTNFAYLRNNWSYLMYYVGIIFPSLVVEPHLANRMYPASWKFNFLVEEFGFLHLQATKPDTIGTVLNDTPTGLLVYILEKFSTWADFDHKHKQDGGLPGRYSKDMLIDNLMYYWAPNKMSNVLRWYAENMSIRQRGFDMDGIKTPVPTWAYQARYELQYQPPIILKSKYPNLLGVTVAETGGHFLASEFPDVMVDDIFKAVKLFKEFNAKNQRTEL